MKGVWNRKMFMSREKRTLSVLSWFIFVCMFGASVVLYSHVYMIPARRISTEHTRSGPPIECLINMTGRNMPNANINTTSVIIDETKTIERNVNISSNNTVPAKKASAPRKITSRQRRVQRMLAATVTKLQYWEQNKTRAEVIRNDLNQMNGSDFIFTQENSPVGRMYYNTYHRRAAKIDGSRRKLLPKVSPFSNTTLFRTCAVIGNGGVLKNSGCGKDIDSFDFVFRSNLQPIKNYSTDAGMKTNMTSLNPSVIKLRFHHLKKQEHKTDLLKALKEYEGYLLWIPNSATITTTMAFKAAKIIQEDTRLQILLVDADHCRHFGKYWQIKRIISTGMILVNIAISLCEEIHVYGFWPFRMDVRGNPLLMHYTDDLKWSSYHYVHDYSREFTLLTKLHFDGVIKLHVNQCMES